MNGDDRFCLLTQEERLVAEMVEALERAGYKFPLRLSGVEGLETISNCVVDLARRVKGLDLAKVADEDDAN